MMPSSHLILCRPLLLLPPIPPSIRVFSNEATLHMRRPKYCSFSFSISPSNEHPGMISLRMDWLDLLAVQGTLKSSQHHSSKASILQCSAFFTVQLSHPYITTGKTIALMSTFRNQQITTKGKVAHNSGHAWTFLPYVPTFALQFWLLLGIISILPPSHMVPAEVLLSSHIISFLGSQTPNWCCL